MKEIGYKAWALLPADSNPTSGEVVTFNPPMLTAVSLDRNTSLVFRFGAPPGALHIQLEAPAISAEGRGADVLRVFAGRAADRYGERTYSGWERAFDGLYATFSTRVETADTYLKLHFEGDRPLVVNRINFFSP